MNLCHFHGWIGISVSGLVGFFVCVFLFASLSHDHCPKLCFYFVRFICGSGLVGLVLVLLLCY